MIAALLLDLDGTLVDSEPLHVAAHRAFLPTVGMDISDDELAQNVGRGDAQMYRELIAAARHRRRRCRGLGAAQDRRADPHL